jgi:putative two-component system response regulator
MASMSAQAASRRTILVVDDSPFIVAEMEEVLRPHYEVRCAHTGAAALALARQPPLPALILLDLVLPDLGGLGVLARLRADPATAGIPVVFVTAADADADIERGLRAGAVDYITKPLVVDDLLARCLRFAGLRAAG